MTGRGQPPNEKKSERQTTAHRQTMPRKLPLLTPVSAPFWQGGAHGVLNICCCGECQHLFHPPAPVCPQCLSTDVGPRAVSGRGEVVSFTVNHQAWTPETAVPYVVAIVELAE